MLASDLVLNPSTSIAAGTNAAKTYALLQGTSSGKSIRSVASVALTHPDQITISHSTRIAKGFKTDANASVPAPDVIFDRHLVRVDQNLSQTGRLDPDNRINYSVQLVIETPRIGSDSPTSLQIADTLKAIVASLDASTRANLERVLNGET